MAGLPTDALVRGYVNGSSLAQLGGAAAGSSVFKSVQNLPGLGSGGIAGLGTGQLPKEATDVPGGIGFTVTAEKDALRFEATLEPPKGQSPPSYAPQLLGRVPADALAAVSFKGGDQLTKQLRDTLGAASLKQTEQQLGVSLDDLGTALDGEGVLYVRAGSPLPEVTLVAQPKEPARAQRTLAKLVGQLGNQSGALPLSLTTSSSNGLVFVSTSKTPAATFTSSGAALTQSKSFKQATADVGLGKQTNGFAYVDVRGLAPLLKSVLGAGSSTSSGGGLNIDSLGALDSLAVNATTTDSGRLFVKGLLRVR
jgi:hypothetical protein